MKKEPVPYYELPVYKTIRKLYKDISTNSTIDSIPKAPKRRMVEPALEQLWEVMANIYEVREVEKQLGEEEHPLPGLHRDAAALLLESRRKTARCLIAIRTIYETKVSTNDLRPLITTTLYNSYAQDLVSVYKQLGFWARKHLKLL